MGGMVEAVLLHCLVGQLSQMFVGFQMLAPGCFRQLIGKAKKLAGVIVLWLLTKLAVLCLLTEHAVLWLLTELAAFC